MATGDLAYAPFNHQHPFPPDLRMQRDTINARDVISAPIRWEGMLVYVLENQKTYQLQGGLTNEYWVEFLGSEGGSISNAVLYTIQSLTPAEQLQARLNIGAGELMDGLISLGPVTSLVNDVTIDSVLARIDGMNVEVTDPTTINVPVPAAGNIRRDLIVIDGSGLIYLVQGTEVLEGETAITPNVPNQTVVLVETFSNDTGLQDIYDFAYSSFVRFDINNQGLSPDQRLNARTNIQAVSKDTNDVRTGSLRQQGLLTVIGDYRQEVQNGTSSTNAWAFINPLGGGASFRRSGGLTVVSMGDSMTDYLIFRGFDNTGTEVFRVRQGGVTKGGNAINLDDFVTLGQVNGLIETGTGEFTEMSGDDFFIGYRVDGAERIEQIFDKDDKDVIVTDTGNIILNPTQSVGNFIFTGSDLAAVTEVRGIETAIDGREIHLTNRSGAIIPLIDGYVGGPPNSAFDFGGVNYNLAIGETISLIGNGSVWVQNTLNQVAFSDNIDSVASDRIIAPDGSELISKIISPYTLQPVDYKKVTNFITGIPMTDTLVDDDIYKKIGAEYFGKNEFLNGKAISVRDFGARGNGTTDDTASIQKAFDFAATTFIDTILGVRAKIYFPSGIYRITQTINMYASCIMEGEGAKVSIIKSEITGNGHVFQFLNTGHLGSGVSVHKLGVIGINTSLATDGYAFRLDAVSVNTFSDLVIKGLGGGGMWLTGGFVNWINNCHISLNAKNDYWSTVDGTQDYAAIYNPRIGTGNSLHVSNTYISNNTKMDGIHFVGQTGRFDRVTMESGQRLMVIGEYATTSRAIHLNDCYFEASRKYDIDIREARELIITNSYHNDSLGETISALKIGTLTNATFNTCHFGTKGVEVDRSSVNRIRQNVLFQNCFGVNFNGGDHGLNGIKVKNDLDYNNPSGGYGLTKNLYRASDNLTHPYWQKTGTPTVTQDQIFLDGNPAYSVLSTTAQALYFNITSVVVGDKLCVSFYLKSTTTGTTYIRFRGARVSDGVSEDFGGIRIATDEGKWERHFISQTISAHQGTIQVRFTPPSTGASFTRVQYEKGVLTPGIPILTSTLPVDSNNIQGVTNGDHFLQGLVQQSSDGSLFRCTPNDNGSANVEKWISNAWVTQGTNPLILTASPALDFGDILAGESATLTATVTGASLLDNVNVSGPSSIYSANATIDAWVSSSNTVSVRVRNFGGTTINPASGTFNIKVFK